MRMIMRVMRLLRKRRPVIAAAWRLVTAVDDALADGKLTKTERSKIMQRFWELVDSVKP
jgi:hypothetical protein